MLKYQTRRNPKPIALDGATISANDFIFYDGVNGETKFPIQFQVDSGATGKDTFANGSPARYRPSNSGLIGSSNNVEMPNNLAAGEHTIAVIDREGTEIDSATFTIG